MKVEVLTAAMFKDMSLYDAMNIQTDAVIINQCDISSREERVAGGHLCRLYSYNERGVGKSRNRALDEARGDILLFADEDVIYEDGYGETVLKAFCENPDADAFIFNINVCGGSRDEVQIKKSGKMTYKEALSFGAVRLAVRKSRIGDIRFSLLFGGGAKYGSGEDTLFIQELFRNGLRVYKSTDVIACVMQDTSSWFDGYTDKYFFDKGALYGALWGGRAKLLAAAASFRWCRKLGRHDYFHILGQYFKGIDEYTHTVNPEKVT